MIVLKTLIVVKEDNMVSSQESRITPELILLYEESFKIITHCIRKNKPNLVVFVTFDSAIPKDWDVRLLNSTNYIIFQNVNKYKLPQVILYLNSITSRLELPKLLKNKVISDSIRYILTNLNNSNLSIELVSSKFHLNPHRFSKKFREHSSIYFKDFLIRARMIYAKKLLLKDISITTVCFETGYEDLTHFSRMFKKKYGMTPSQYKKQKKQTRLQSKAENEF
ncbi:AraC family transcriptional regulator [Bacillus sp. 166amftsu]|uniref:helix-turn-helix domain-containing protein n=1 Tax=Bacillus sp. 166amftsu TaxID=1761753 RepID=UPI00089890F7|nr:AraC family transcriptional regulator [Bacillus sp. 166amftsu]SDZ37771.1 AraC-type DNA-binding protein [Bacillus sp. 166amftsu]